MEKILRICSSRELPPLQERDENYLYLTYDKLLLFFGQNPYYDPFVICENVPIYPVQGYLYILLNGEVKSLIGDDIVNIANIEESSQLDILKTMGTTYFIKADRRYLDLQYRILQLPYHNGTYSMNVDLAKDLIIDDDTQVRYDQETEEFYIEGNHMPPPKLRRYSGSETKTVKIQVNNHCIHADIKLSSSPRNMLKIINSGLYINTDDKVSVEKFKDIRDKFLSYRAESNEMIETLQKEIEAYQIVVSPDSILGMVQNAVKKYFSDIDQWMNFLDTVQQQLMDLETECKEYTDRVFNEKYNALHEEISSGITANVWGTF